MSYRGRITPMSRHGLNRSDNTTGPLVRSSFEETVDTLWDAAMFAEVDPGQGVTYSCMSGEESNIIGTGCFDLLLPDDAVHGHVQPPKSARRLAKSVVSYAAAPEKAPRGDVVGYVDKGLWCFKPDGAGGSADAIKHPFLGARDDSEQDGDGSRLAPFRDGRAAYEPAADSGAGKARRAMYVPASPKMA